MALAPSFYSTGTATVAANGTAVTGQGTSWLNAVQPGDVFGTHKGIPIRIASVNSNTSLTLAYPWPGTAQNAAAYEIQLLPDAGRLVETSRLLLEKLTSGNVDALAGLPGEADRLPYFTGSGAMAVAAFTALARNILGRSDTSALLAFNGPFGPVFGGTAPEPSAAGVGLADGDFNTVNFPGVYTIAGTWSNGPSGTGAYTGILEVYSRRFNNLLVQKLRQGSTTNHVVYRRVSGDNGLTWTAWQVIESPILGTVTAGAAGAIIERGSNANGEYVRFADGTQICTFSAPGVGCTIASGPLFRSEDFTWTYPVAFASVPTWSASVQSTARWGNCRQTSGTTVGTFNQHSTFNSATALGWSLTAIGRWF